MAIKETSQDLLKPKHTHMKMGIFFANLLRTQQQLEVNLLAPVFCEPASSRTSVYETDPPQVDNFEHLKYSCTAKDVHYLLHNG